MEAIKRKLERDIVPWLESAEKCTSWTLFRIYSLYFWLGELFVFLVGLGFSHPAFRVLAPQAVKETETSPGQPIIASLGEGIMFWLAVIGLVAWGLLKIYVMKNDLEKRCSLIKSGVRQFRQFRMQLNTVLQKSNPLEGLLQLQEAVNETINRVHGEDAWPWPRGLAPRIDALVAAEVDRYVRQYADSWTAVPQTTDIQRR